jgi:hypothetical protein
MSSPTDGAPLSVQGRAIDLALVVEVAAAQGVTAEAAASALTEDAVLARSVEESNPALTAYLGRIALARRLSERIVARARAAGPPSQEELTRFTERHWWVLDRPALSRVVHALVRAPEGTDRFRARSVSEQLRQALSGVTTEEEFRKQAEGFASDGFDLEVESLQPVAADGRAVEPANPPRPGARTSRYAKAFSEAAAALGEVGTLSDVVETSFGFHVLLLTERIPEKRLSAEERSRTLLPEIVSARARAAEREIIERAKLETSPEVNVAALAQMEGFSGEP